MSRGEAAVMGAAFGLVNPVAWDTLATGSQMKQDARIAARQEWTSWKQWALSHADWPSFKTDAVAAYRDSLVEAEAWEEDPNNHEAFRTAIAEGKARDAEEVKRGIRLALAVLAALAGVVGFLLLTDHLSQTSPPPLPEPAATEIR
jgi:hypothetical protein